jgi:hypothetical protein
MSGSGQWTKPLAPQGARRAGAAEVAGRAVFAGLGAGAAGAADRREGDGGDHRGEGVINRSTAASNRARVRTTDLLSRWTVFVVNRRVGIIVRPILDTAAG